MFRLRLPVPVAWAAFGRGGPRAKTLSVFRVGLLWILLCCQWCRPVAQAVSLAHWHCQCRCVTGSLRVLLPLRLTGRLLAAPQLMRA